MRGTWATIRVAVVALSIAGCDAVVPSASPEAGSGLCWALTEVYAERAALGDAFQIAIDGNMDEAIEQAHTIRVRLDAIVGNLPLAVSLSKPKARLVDQILSDARLIGGAAGILDDPETKLVDRDVVLAEGRIVLELMDDVFAMRQPGDAIEMICPGFEFSAEPLSFPPPPTNAALGLPDTVTVTLATLIRATSA